MAQLSQALDRHRHRLHSQGRTPSPTPSHRGTAGRPSGTRHRPPSCGSKPHTCQGEAPHSVGLGLLEAHDIGPGGAVTERLRASGAIATAATHPAHGPETVARRHTWQVAMQVAAGRALYTMPTSYAGRASMSLSPSRARLRPETSNRPATARRAPGPRTAASRVTTLVDCNSSAHM